MKKHWPVISLVVGALLILTTSSPYQTVVGLTLMLIWLFRLAFRFLRSF